jgi:epoxyqueuosine reductase
MLRRLSLSPRPPYVPWKPEYRCSPRFWLPEARSVLVGAVSYLDRYARDYSSPPLGKGYLSPFAWEPDYHEVVLAKLKQLGDYLEKLQPGTKYILQADNGPGCERLYAWRSGVGWQGKNNFIVVPNVGSFVWLGLLVTDLELPPDVPLADQCGACQLCLEACPTKAYKEDYVYDYTRCMAYLLTVKKSLSLPQRRALSRHRMIYGCDFCQLACPHNKPVEDAPSPWLNVESLLAMPASEFKAFFRRTAASWRGSNVLRRNVVLAAAASGSCLEVLQKLARGEGLVAETARAVLADIDQEQGPCSCFRCD